MRAERIRKLIEDYFEVDLSEKTRRREVVQYRYLYYSLAYTHAVDGRSLRSIGETLGGFNHATVLHGIKQHENLYQYDRLYKSLVCPFLMDIEQELNDDSMEYKRSLRRQHDQLRRRIFKIEKQLQEIE